MMPVIRALNSITFINDLAAGTGNMDKDAATGFLATLQNQSQPPSALLQRLEGAYKPQSAAEMAALLGRGNKVILEGKA